MWKILFITFSVYVYCTTGIQTPNRIFSLKNDVPAIKEFIKNDALNLVVKTGDIIWDFLYNLLNDTADKLKEITEVGTDNIPEVDTEKSRENIRYMVRRSNPQSIS